MPSSLQNKPRRGITRRWFLRGLLCGVPALAMVDGFWIEPHWLAVRRLNLSRERVKTRFVFFTDLHHKGDRKFLDAVVRKINAFSPKFVCFGGDIVEDTRYLADALAGLKQIKAPLFGVPGDHDYRSHADFDVIDEAFTATGGRWLLDETAFAAGNEVQIAGATCKNPPAFKLRDDVKRVVLIHYPQFVEKLEDIKFDIALAGHSHGGQVRLPFIGPLVTPYGVGPYDLGFYNAPTGPLYVGAGIGWFYLDVRFRCRPEITVIDL